MRTGKRLPQAWRAIMRQGWLLAVLMIGANPRDCSADLVISIMDPTPFTVSRGDMVSFDVIITNSGGPSIDIAAFALELSLSDPADGVTFTAAAINTTIDYIFVDSFAANFTGGDLNSDPGGNPFPNTNFTASDLEFDASGARTIVDGQSFGLAHVSFSVSSDAGPGTRNIILGAGTSLSDSAANPLSFMPAAGTSLGSIVVTPAAVPEPGTLALAGLSFGAVLLAQIVRRGRAKRGEETRSTLG